MKRSQGQVYKNAITAISTTELCKDRMYDDHGASIEYQNLSEFLRGGGSAMDSIVDDMETKGFLDS